MNIILFYITEFGLYAGVMIAVIIFAWRARNKSNSYQVRRNIGIFVMLVFLLLFGFLGPFIKPYFTNYEKYRFYDEKSKTAYCFRGTGVFINESQVMTNDHVVKGCKNVAVKFGDETYLGKVIANLPRKEGDIAFIATKAKVKNFALISQYQPEINNILIYPNYTSKPGVFTKSKGKIVYFSGSDPYGVKFLSPKGRKGNSGSPIYDQNGYLVGVLHSSAGLFVNYGVGAPISLIKKFADKNNVQLYYNQDKDLNLTKRKGFYKNFAATILCGR